MFFYYINLISFEKQKQTVLNIQKLNDHEKTFVVLVGMPVPYDRNGNGKNCKGAGYSPFLSKVQNRGQSLTLKVIFPWKSPTMSKQSLFLLSV